MDVSAWGVADWVFAVCTGMFALLAVIAPFYTLFAMCGPQEVPDGDR